MRIPGSERFEAPLGKKNCTALLVKKNPGKKFPAIFGQLHSNFSFFLPSVDRWTPGRILWFCFARCFSNELAAQYPFSHHYINVMFWILWDTSRYRVQVAVSLIINPSADWHRGTWSYSCIVSSLHSRWYEMPNEVLWRNCVLLFFPCLFFAFFFNRHFFITVRYSIIISFIFFWSTSVPRKEHCILMQMLITDYLFKVSFFLNRPASDCTVPIFCVTNSQSQYYSEPIGICHERLCNGAFGTLCCC